MITDQQTGPIEVSDRESTRRRRGIDPRRIAPALVAGVLAAVYLILSPPSLDLAAHMFRAQLFRMEGFSLWNNMWYSGHHIVGYSLLFPPVSALLSPQLAAALAATGTAALFEPLARRHYGPDAWVGAVLFAAATAVDLFTGRLAFAFGALPAVGAVLALDRRRSWIAAGLALLTALSSPVAALFLGLAASAYAIGAYAGERRLRPALPGLAVAVACLAPVGMLAIAFPEGGHEPFAAATLVPVLALALGAMIALPRDAWKLRAGVLLYALATVAAYVLATPVGSNDARLGAFMAAPLAALLWWPRRVVLLAVLAVPLLYVEWHDPARDLSTAIGDPSAASGYYEPLLDFMERQPGPPFRTEIPFTRFHWEVYVVAPHYALARGWERQLDIKDNALFYGGRLTAASYEAWLHQNAVRFVAAADAPVDYSAQREITLIDHGLPYLRLVMHARHWRVYEVANATPIVQGAAVLRAMGPDSLTLHASHPGTALIHVHFSPYWALSQGAGCVAPWGQFTSVTIRRPGSMRLVMRFSLDRIGASSPRCS
jgi:hypothetical protein